MKKYRIHTQLRKNDNYIYSIQRRIFIFFWKEDSWTSDYDTAVQQINTFKEMDRWNKSKDSKTYF